MHPDKNTKSVIICRYPCSKVNYRLAYTVLK